MEKTLVDQRHRHYITLDKKEKVIWLCGCRDQDFRKGEKEAFEKMFVREFHKQDRAN